MKLNWITSSVITLLASTTNLALAQSTANGTATMSVLSAISVTNTSGLGFTTGAAGDPSETVVPNTPAAAAFDITAEPNTAVNFSVDETSIGLDTGGTNCGGSPVSSTTCIVVGTFTFTGGGTAVTNGAGSLSVSVGATRAALDSAQQSGSYLGTFTLSVTY